MALSTGQCAGAAALYERLQAAVRAPTHAASVHASPCNTPRCTAAAQPIAQLPFATHACPRCESLQALAVCEFPGCAHPTVPNMTSSAASRYPTVPLSNGLNMPMLGLGTSHHGGYSHEAVVFALQKCGIRHIDTAKRYGCESHLKEAIRESGVKRQDLWITTKLWPGDCGFKKTPQACLESCERLGTEYLDLYLMHWPDAHIPGKSSREARAETWRAMEDLYDKGICRAIGVSNFQICHLEQLKEDCDMIPHVNQVEYHPFQRPQELVDYCRNNNIVFEGYCPLAKGEALTHPVIIEFAKKYSRTPAQICIRWSIQNGVVTIPKSTKSKRIKENCEVFDFTLTEDDVAMINGMHYGRHVSWDPTSIL